MCRPLKNQQILWNGYKSVPVVKFQSVLTPNEGIVNLFGSVEGKWVKSSGKFTAS